MKNINTLFFIGFVIATSGCASKASDDMLSTMCDNKLKITGGLRGTVYEEEATRITEEYDKKEKSLKGEMERDLGGMDDVLAGRMKDIEGSEDSAEAKAEKFKAAKEDIENKKKAIVDQFEPLIKKLTPQKEYALNDAKEYVEKRKSAAEDAKKTCIEQAKKAEVTEAIATCRSQATSAEAYDACK